MKRTSWVALGTLVLLGGFIVYSSLESAGVRCEVCIEFRGRRACRAVDGPTEQDALPAAQTNACSELASGVTDTMACTRTPAASTKCHPRSP